MKNLIKKLGNPKVLRILLPVLLSLIALAGFVGFELFQGRVFIDDSLVDAPLVTITSTSGGTISEVDAYEGEQIRKGDPIAVVGGQMIYAPTAGTVSMVDNAVGSSATAATTQIAQIVDNSQMRIAGTIDENKGLDQVHVGQVASFTVDALPGQTFWGYVDEVSPAAKVTSLSFSISSERPTQQFVVYARFDETKYPMIKQGMSAKLTVYTNTKGN